MSKPKPRSRRTASNPPSTFLRGVVLALLAIAPATAFATQDDLPSWIAFVLTAVLAIAIVAILLAAALDDEGSDRRRDRQPEYDER
jgi:hypothetical protein